MRYVGCEQNDKHDAIAHRLPSVWRQAGEDAAGAGAKEAFSVDDMQ